MGMMLTRKGAGVYEETPVGKEASDYLDRVGMYICCTGPRIDEGSDTLAKGILSSSTDKNDSPAPFK